MDNYSTLCRTCLSDNENQISVFDANLVNTEFLTYSHMINFCTNVEIKHEDLLPTNICKDCHSDIIRAFAFRQKCQKSDLFFKQLLNSLNIIKEDVNYNQETPNENSYELKSTQIIDSNEQKTFKIDADQNLNNPYETDSTNHKNDFNDKQYPNSNTIKSEPQLEENSPLNDIMKLVTGNDENYVKNSTESTFREDLIQTIKEEPPLIAEDYDYMHDEYDEKVSDSNHSNYSEFNNRTSDGTKKCDLNIAVDENTEEELIYIPESLIRCEICKKDLRVSSISGHKREYHSNEQQYECLICFKKFRYKSSYRRHKIEVHSKEHRYECLSCSKKFRHKSSYTRHTKVHLDTKDFHCTYCPSSFSYSFNLKRHIKTRHRLTNPEQTVKLKSKRKPV